MTRSCPAQQHLFAAVRLPLLIKLHISPGALPVGQSCCLNMSTHMPYVLIFSRANIVNIEAWGRVRAVRTLLMLHRRWRNNMQLLHVRYYFFTAKSELGRVYSAVLQGSNTSRTFISDCENNQVQIL